MSELLQFSLSFCVKNLWGAYQNIQGPWFRNGHYSVLGWVLLPAAHTSLGMRTAGLLRNQLLNSHILLLSIYGNLTLVMSCVKMLLPNCTDSATDSQVAQPFRLLEQEDVQLAAIPLSAIPSYTVSYKVKFRFTILVMPGTDSSATRPEIK